MQNKFFPAISCDASFNVLTGWLLLMSASALSVFIFLRLTNRRSFPFGFLCANIGLAFLLTGSVVMIPNICSRASSMKMSSLRLIDAGRFWQ